MRKWLFSIAFTLTFAARFVGAAALGTAFTYQGRLTDAGGPASGVYDLELRLFDAGVAGAQVGPTLVREDVNVTNGLFTVSLDFGAAPFSGNASWLGMGVRPGASTGSFTALSPRQELTPTPNALFASRSGDAVPQGAIVAFAGGVAPTGWLLADGSEVSRATYAALYAAIGDAYGAGDGATTFNLPNLQQRFPIGRAPTGRASVLGEAGGVIDHVHSYSDVPIHVHPVDPPTTGSTSSTAHVHPASDAWGYVSTAESGVIRRPLFGFKPDDAGYPGVPIMASDGAHSHTVDIASFDSGAPAGGVATGTTNAQNPPYLTVHYIIKH